MNIVMLVGEGDLSKIVYNGLIKDFDIKMVIEDTAISRKYYLKRRIKKLGFNKVFGQMLFMLYNKWLLVKSKDRISVIKMENELSSKFYSKKKFIKVKSVNSQETIQLLLQISPDIVVVNGTRIISRKVLQTIDAVFINIHVGITPKYRGVHGGYWALVNDDAENCGVSVHLVDEGIDTGGVLYQDVIEVNNLDNFNTYPYLQISKAIPLIKNAINDVISGAIVEKKILNSHSFLFYHPTILEYFRNRLKGIK